MLIVITFPFLIVIQVKRMDSQYSYTYPKPSPFLYYKSGLSFLSNKWPKTLLFTITVEIGIMSSQDAF